METLVELTLKTELQVNYYGMKKAHSPSSLRTLSEERHKIKSKPQCQLQEKIHHPSHFFETGFCYVCVAQAGSPGRK